MGATSLRDIPGVKDRRKLRAGPLLGKRRAARDQRDRRHLRPRRTKRIQLSPRPLPIDGRRHTPILHPRRRPDYGLMALFLLFAFLIIGGAKVVWDATRVRVEASGIADGMALTPEDAASLEATITFDRRDDLTAAELTFNGEDVLDSDDVEQTGKATVDGSTIVWTAPPKVPEGEHRLRLAVPRFAFGDAVFAWDMTVDGTAPEIDVPAAVAPVPIDEPVRIAGRVEPEARLTVNGDEMATDDGRFVLEYDRPPAGAIELAAADRAGNRSSASLVVPVELPAMHGVHVTAAAWAHAELRQGIVELIDAGLIDTVQLDLKDEDGIVGYASQVPKAQSIGAVRAEYDLAEAVRFLHGKGVHVVGRIVAFRDPVLAGAAWAAGDHDQVIQAPDGQPLPVYGGYTNYTHPEVRRYNLDIAAEAVSLGVDNILWDYVRRPEGNPESMVIPGLGDRTTSQAIAAFLGEAQTELRAMGAVHGAAVFGIAADRPDTIGQRIPLLGPNVDYIAPMVYPSHFVDGEYRVESPIRQPAEIVAAALADFQEKAEGTGARIVPWLQDFSLFGVPYGPAEVRAQIDATSSLGIDGFLLWNPHVRYTAGALSPLDG